MNTLFIQNFLQFLKHNSLIILQSFIIIMKNIIIADFPFLYLTNFKNLINLIYDFYRI